MHVITMTTLSQQAPPFCTGNEKKKQQQHNHNFSIVEKGDQWIQNGYTGLNHEMHIFR